MKKIAIYDINGEIYEIYDHSQNNSGATDLRYYTVVQPRISELHSEFMDKDSLVTLITMRIASSIGTI